LSSGFTAWVGVRAGQDSDAGFSSRYKGAPAPPTIFKIVGGFKQVTIFFAPPPDEDFQCAQIFLSPTNDFNDPGRQMWGESARRSIEFTATDLIDDFTYYFWLASKDTSGNVGGLNTGINAGTPATTRKIGPGDVVTTNLITQFAQIGVAVMNEAYAATLTAD